jgi:hypothetical protein
VWADIWIHEAEKTTDLEALTDAVVALRQLHRELSGIPRKQGINAPAGFDKGIFPCDGLSRSPASGLGDNLTHG